MSKLCPRKVIPIYEGVKFGDCDGDRCGWWNSNLKECAITSISAIAFMLGKINENSK